MSIIIVAEDDFIMSEYLSGILTEKGYSVIAVANADDAIAMFEHRDDVRMLITDINIWAYEWIKFGGHGPRPLAWNQNRHNDG
jgi:CheY-like chemotaxis protein